MKKLRWVIAAIAAFGLALTTLPFGEWWLVIDADEKIVKAPGYTKKAFHDWLDSITSDYSAIALDVKDIQNGNVAMNCNSARMFRKGSVHYRRRVHNQPIFQSPAILCHFIFLEHYGYDLSPEEMESKFERTHTLLMRELEENPDDYDIYFYLCQLFGHHDRDAESREWGLKYLALKDKMPESKFNSTISFTLIKNYQETGEYEEAYKLIREVLAERPHDPDICSALCDHGAMTNNHPIISSDGRPIFSFTAKELARMILDISMDCLIIPAHAWTPWFSIFGANSGFDSIEEFSENCLLISMRLKRVYRRILK